MDEKNVKNTKGLMIGGIVLVVLLFLTVLAYLLIPTKPKKVFTTAIEKVYNTSKENQTKEFTGGKFTIKTDLHSNKTNEEKILEILNNLNISIDYKVDTNSKRMHMALDSDYKEKDLLKASIDIKDNNAYVFLEDIYSKYLSVPVEGIEEMFTAFEKIKDYETLLKQVKNALDKSLKEEYFSKESATITLNGKNVKVTDNQLVLNEKNVKEIANVLSDELNNEEFIKSYSAFTDCTEEETKEMLESLKTEEIDLEGETLIVSIYTKGLQNKFAGIAFKDESDRISILKNTETNYTYEIKMDNKNYKGDVEIKENEKNINMKISFDIEGIHGSIALDYVNNNDVNIPDVDTKNAVSSEDLSQKEAMEILEKLQENEGIVELVQALSTLSSIGLDF